MFSVAIFKPMFFVGEDISLITTTSGLDLKGAVDRIWGQSLIGDTDEGGLYRPLTLTTYHIERVIWGLRPTWYHYTNLLLNAICVVLLFLIALQLFKSRLFAGLAAGLFLFHPAHPATVYWISARADLLCTAFYLAGLLFSIRYALDNRFSNLIIAGLAFLLAIFSKEMAVSAPLVAPIFVYAIAKPEKKKRLLAVFIAALIPIAVYATVRIALLGSKLATGESYYFPSIGYLTVNLAKAAGFLAIPFGHSTAEQLLFANKGLFMAIAAFTGAALLAVIVLISRKDRRIPILIAATVISLLPVIGMTMRWHMYLPSAFLVILVAYLVFEKAPRPYSAAIFSIIILLFVIGFFQLRGRMIKSADFAKELVKKAAVTLSQNRDAESLTFLLLPSKVHRSATYTNGFLPTLQNLTNDKRLMREMLPSVHYNEYHSCDFELDNARLRISFDSVADYIAPRVRSYIIGEKRIAAGEEIVTQDNLRVKIMELSDIGRVSEVELDLRQKAIPEKSRIFIYVNNDWQSLRYRQNGAEE